jgi:hypothetical protein
MPEFAAPQGHAILRQQSGANSDCGLDPRPRLVLPSQDSVSLAPELAIVLADSRTKAVAFLRLSLESS